MKPPSTGYRRGFIVVQGGAGNAPPPSDIRQLAGMEQLEYLSDMIRQLQRIARLINCATLAGILELAFREVDLKRRDQRGRL